MADGVQLNKGSARGVVSALAAGCLWGSVGIFVRILDGYGYTPQSIVFVRVSIAFVIMVLVILILGKRELFRIRLKDAWCLIGAGVSSALMLSLFYSMSIVMNSLSLAAVLLSTAPVFVVLISAPLFKEKITSVKLQALVIVFVGCVFVSGAIDADKVFSLPGFVIGLLAALGIAVNSIMVRFSLNCGYHPMTVSTYSFGFGSLSCIPFTQFALIASTVTAAPGNMAVFLILHTLCAALIPYVLFISSMRFLDTGKASILTSVEPVAATIFGLMLFSEVPTGFNVLGIAIVLVGIAVLNVKGGLRRLLQGKNGS